MGNMRLRYRIPLAIIAILIVMTLFMGSSYALWKTTDYQETVNQLAAGCFELSFQEESKSINLNNAYPMEDEKGFKTKPYTFTLTNTCTTDAEYKIFLNTLGTDENKIADNLIKVALIEENGALNNAQKLNSILENTDLSNFAYAKPILNSYVLGTGKLKGKQEGAEIGESVTYDLRIWIDSSATNTKKDLTGNVISTGIDGKTFEAAVASVAYATKIS